MQLVTVSLERAEPTIMAVPSKTKEGYPQIFTSPKGAARIIEITSGISREDAIAMLNGEPERINSYLQQSDSDPSTFLIASDCSAWLIHHVNSSTKIEGKIAETFDFAPAAIQTPSNESIFNRRLIAV